MEYRERVRKWSGVCVWLSAAALSITGVVGLSGCDDDDPVEEAAEEVGDEIDDATD